ncbi:MAG: flagellar export chaperone FlgN [Pseudodesulfovibrio sp.]
MSYRLIEENLVRQNKAMILLSVLLEEEFSRLKQGAPQQVSLIELSIQELMRQIAAERYSLRRLVGAAQQGAQKVRELFASMEEGARSSFEQMLAVMDKSEQRCAVQASKNNALAMALFDQSKKLLNFMHNQIKPKNTDAYAATGRFARARSDARILTGRL